MNRCAAVLLFSVFFTISSAAQKKASVQRQPPGDVLLLRDGWTLQSSCKVDKKGEVISTPQFAPAGWHAVTVPTTVVAALVKDKVYPDPMFGMNLRSFATNGVGTAA